MEEKSSHKFLNFFLLLVILSVLLVLYAKYVGTKGLIVKEYRVESDVLSYNFSGSKIVHFSDLLYKSTVDKNDVKKLVNKINILKPDIVVFTGNLVTNSVKITDDDTEFLIEELSKIKVTIDKYAIYGEIDYEYDDYDEVMTKSGFNIINNSYEEIYSKNNEPIYIVGLPCSLKETPDLDSSFKFYKEEDRRFIIVLVHDGKTIKYLDESDYEVDMILGGYSLNGSVVLPIYGGVFKEKSSYKYSEPYYEKGITKIFISSGLGTKKYDYRFLNKPSFNLYRLKAQP